MIKMKNLNILFINILLIINSYVISQTREKIKDSLNYKIYFYENGKKSSEGFLNDGKPDGYWKTYYENGNVKSEGNRDHFELDSIWKFYDEEGKMLLVINYKNGKKNGVKKTFLKEGMIEETYVNDIKQGLVKRYYPDGKIKSIIPCVQGKENGKAFEFSEDSVIIVLSEYKKGFMIYKEKINGYNVNKLKDGKWMSFYNNGNVKTEENYKNGLREGYFKEYTEEGSLIKIEKYTNDQLQQDAQELVKLDTKYDFYPNGKIKVEGTYNDSIAEGVRRYFSEKGDVISSKIFKEGIVIGEGIVDKKGRKQGAWKEYYFPGKSTDNKRVLKSEGTYKNDKRINKWKFYYPNGNPEQIGAYNNNSQPIGDWKWYLESGIIRREESFVDGLAEGMMIEYNDSNKIIAKGNFIAGLEEGFWFYHVGDERQEGNYVAGKRSGEWKHYYDEKHLRFEGSYVDGVEDGKHIYYWDNGYIKEDGIYEMGKKEGDWKINNDDGTLFMTIFFKNGQELRYDGIKILHTK